jgi:hypothetical protein
MKVIAMVVWKSNLSHQGRVHLHRIIDTEDSQRKLNSGLDYIHMSSIKPNALGDGHFVFTDLCQIIHSSISPSMKVDFRGLRAFYYRTCRNGATWYNQLVAAHWCHISGKLQLRDKHFEISALRNHAVHELPRATGAEYSDTNPSATLSAMLPCLVN